ncbi:MAG: MOSC domain-containing protein [Rhodospirillales bacterium]|nr:MOSC domain-containing protein [Rhodospirillales bacterium]
MPESIDSRAPGPDAEAMPATIESIRVYPVKGLSGQTADRVPLSPGEPLPNDRRFALALAGAAFDPLKPEWLPKGNFLMLQRNEKLARLDTAFDPETGILEIRRSGKIVKRADITKPIGRALIEDFFAAFMGAEARGKPRLVEAPGHMFSDTRPKVLSLINLASVGDLERVAGGALDPVRFRGNLHMGGLDAWAEFDWLDRELAIGDVRLRVIERIQRCAATDVNPRTAERDRNIPKALMSGYGHPDLGVYAQVETGGEIAAGDEIRLID